MFITVPENVRLRLLVDSQNRPIDAYAEGDPEAPAPPDGAKWPTTELEFVRDFVRRVLLNDKSWGATMDLVYAAEELRGLFHGKKPGDAVELTKAQHDALMGVLRAPAEGYSQVIAPMLVSFFHAIERASSKRPTREPDVKRSAKK